MSSVWLYITIAVLVTGFFGFHLLKRNARRRLLSEIVERERSLIDPTMTVADIITQEVMVGGPGGPKAYLMLGRRKIYVESALGQRFGEIDLRSVAEVEIYAPNLPQIMNLNAAAILANEATRRQYGDNLTIWYRVHNGLDEATFGGLRGYAASSLASAIRGRIQRSR